MDLKDVINKKWLDSKKYFLDYNRQSPFPHIVMNNFIKEDILKKILTEFPDLSKLKKDSVVKFQNNR